MLPCNHTTPVLPPDGKPYSTEYCRLCWLFAHDHKYNALWGGDGLTARLCRKTGQYGCNCPPRPIIQLDVTADGIGDHCLGLCASQGMKRDNPEADIVFAARGQGTLEWVKLFGGYDHATVGPLPDVKTVRPHDSYARQMAEKTRVSRCEYYGAVTGSSCQLPDEVSLPLEAIQWAERFGGAVVLVPWSHWHDRCWPMSNWLPFERMLRQRGYPVVILDTGAERNKQFTSEVIIGESPARVAALIRGASCLVGNDSGMVHAAGMVRTPAVALCHAIPGEKIFNVYPSVVPLNGPLACLGHSWDDAIHPVADCDGTPCRGLESIRPERVLQTLERLTCRAAMDNTLLGYSKIAALRRAARETAHLPGDMAEVGVYQGGSALAIATAAPGRTLHLFDTWGGLPSDDVDLGYHKKGEFSCSLDDVKAYLSGQSVEFHPGFFPDTTRGLGDKAYSLVHLDGDLYTTTRDSLAYFWPRMTEGGIIVLDDYDWPNTPGVRRAVEEYGLLALVERLGEHQARLVKRYEAAEKPVPLLPRKTLPKKGCGGCHKV
jgi:predicted O-methyltransferase YrrM